MFPISTTFMTRSLAYQVDIRESPRTKSVSDSTQQAGQAREGESSLDSAQSTANAVTCWLHCYTVGSLQKLIFLAEKEMLLCLRTVGGKRIL